jgi:hypothetical protein
MNDRLQFSLSQLLIVVGLSCIGLLWLTPIVLPAIQVPSTQWRRGSSENGQLICAVSISLFSAAGALTAKWRRNPKMHIGLVLCCGAILGQLALMMVIGLFFNTRRKSAIQPVTACMYFAWAQKQCHNTDWNGDGYLEYAESLKELASPACGNLVPTWLAASEMGHPSIAPYSGYVFKVLKRQGGVAPKYYFKKGIDEKLRMTEGFAVVACPQRYDVDGRMTYIVSDWGTVYDCDLGPDTVKIVEQMDVFDPDRNKGWQPTQ